MITFLGGYRLNPSSIVKKVILIFLIFCSLVSINASTYAANSNKENWKNVLTPTPDYSHIAVSDKGLMVAMGDDYMSVSTDGTNWKDFISPIKDTVYEVTWCENKFIAGCEKGVLYSSIDGVKWTKLQLKTDDLIHDILWTGQKILAVGQNGTVITSTDGVKWSIVCKIDTHINSIAWNGKTFTAVGDHVTAYGTRDKEAIFNAVAFYSPDGYKWEQSNYKFKKSDSLDHVIWDGKRFVSNNSSGDLYISNDGVNWSIARKSTGEFDEIKYSKMISNGSKTLIYSNNPDNVFILDDNNKLSKYSSKQALYYSSLIYYNELDDMVWDGHKFIGVGSQALIEESVDGIVWKLCRDETYKNVTGIAYNGTRYVTVGGKIMSSADLKDWKVADIDLPFSNDSKWHYGFNSIATNGKIFVVGGQNGNLYTSEDGLNWTKRNMNSYDVGGYLWNDDFNSIMWDGSRFIAVGGTSDAYHSVDQTAHIYTSVDGISWEAYPNPDESGSTTQIMKGSFRNIIKGDKYLATGYDYNDTMIYLSKDTVSWQPVNTDVFKGYRIFGIAWNGKEYLAIAYKGLYTSAIFKSTDGIKWTKLNTNIDHNNLSDITWDGSKFITMGILRAYTSTDGIEWIPMNIGFSTESQRINIINRRLFFLGLESIITN